MLLYFLAFPKPDGYPKSAWRGVSLWRDASTPCVSVILRVCLVSGSGDAVEEEDEAVGDIHG